ncbi:NTF2 fold immunity protein [Burkholderia sp. BCC1047]|uniref:NTF2 fold immunity protein n=1 Tax=Burkholderia sp. BCC1047 TaxID=2676299 RepID=UPI0015895740|nr:NTF2 fold immunity protein [Burkholderia sp. BCC1047]
MTPAERLTAFIADMLRWEIDLEDNRRSLRDKQDSSLHEQMCADARERLRVIFTEHLSAKALATKAQSRLDLLPSGRPPEFAQKVLEDTESHVGKKIYIETFNEKGLTQRQRYALVIEEGEPKIDAVYDWRRSTDKWDEQDSI